MAEVGAEIRRMREASLDRSAARALRDMAPSAISQIETGRRSPNARSLAEMAKALEWRFGTSSQSVTAAAS